MNEHFTLRYAHENEISNWDSNVLKNRYEAGFLQSKAYADTKSTFGWQIQYMVYEGNHEKIYCYFLSKKVPLLGVLWYIPSGSLPLKYVDSLLKANKKFVQRHKLPVFLIKIEPKILDTPYARRTLKELGLRKATSIQAHTSTILLDLTADLPGSLGPKARRDIRLGSKQDIEVRRLPFSEENCRIMYQLMKTVNRGKGSTFIRPYSYYRAFWSNFSQNGQGNFYFAYEDDRPVVGAFIIHFSDTSVYKDGGSTPDTHYNKRYSVAVQWEAIQDSVKRGDTSYDLCGLPPISDINNTDHPYYGIGQFKLKFSKQTIDYCGCYDQIINPLNFTLWQKTQRIIYKLHWLRYNDLYF